MKRYYLNWLIFLLAIFCLFSCSNPRTPIADLESLEERINDESEDYTQEDWENILDEYYKIEEDLLNYEYSDEELKEIGRLQGKITGKITKNMVNDFRDIIHDLGKQLEGGIDGFLEEIKDIEDLDIEGLDNED